MCMIFGHPYRNVEAATHVPTVRVAATARLDLLDWRLGICTGESVEPVDARSSLTGKVPLVGAEPRLRAQNERIP